MKNLLKTVSVILWCNFLTFFIWGIARAETYDDSKWKTLVTKYTIIQYQSFDDLKKFNMKLSYLPRIWGLEYLSSAHENNRLKNRITKKVDALYERVQEILGMQEKFNKGTITICPNKEELQAAYSRIDKRPRQAYGASSLPRAWYVQQLNTIYINIDDLHEGILAHEMAHSIIDNYLFIRPPVPTAEILARYVDGHLFVE